MDTFQLAEWCLSPASVALLLHLSKTIAWSIVYLTHKWSHINVMGQLKSASNKTPNTEHTLCKQTDKQTDHTALMQDFEIFLFLFQGNVYQQIGVVWFVQTSLLAFLCVSSLLLVTLSIHISIHICQLYSWILTANDMNVGHIKWSTIWKFLLFACWYC